MKISDSVSLSMDSGAAIRGASLPSLSRSTTKPFVTPGYTMRYCRYEAKSPSAVSTTMMLQHLPRRSSASKASCPSAVPIITSSRIISAARQTSSPKASSFRPPSTWTKRNSWKRHWNGRSCWIPSILFLMIPESEKQRLLP